jgi:hypothetical protein
MTDFQEAYNRLELLIEKKYGLDVSISDVIDPNTGDFDGMRIMLDYTLDLELAVFVLLHLFGHTVQWNVSDELRELGTELKPGIDAATLQKIYEYEKDATRYSIALLHEAGLQDLCQWASDWWHADWLYLKHFYLTGEKLDARALFKAGESELLTPLAVPPFKVQKWVSRWSF